MIDHQFYPNIYGEIQMGRSIVAAINCPAVNRRRLITSEKLLLKQEHPTSTEANRRDSKNSNNVTPIVDTI